jgi:putative ABC transport system ATP-binding protein
LQKGQGFLKMNIQLNQLIPVPLRDKIERRSSEVWGNSVNFAPPEWVKIKAPSGSGKTTLIHIMYKLRTDYSGQVSYNGKDIRKLGDEELARCRQSAISVIFQDLRLFGNLTAFENIELKRVLQKPFCEPVRIHEMAEELGIAHILQQPVRICSYGEQQRIAIIRALVQPFELLLMDEPFSHLDEKNSAKAAGLIASECKKRNAGFVLTDLDEDNWFSYNRKLNL